MVRWLWISLFVTACGDGAGQTVDASPDVATVPGDFSCAGQPLPTTAPDPVAVKGKAIDLAENGIGDVAVEVHSSIDDALLGQATTQTTSLARGAYQVDVVTGGVAPRVYRYLHASGYVDSYGYDPRPITATATSIATPFLPPEKIDGYYAAAGLTRDPALATVWLDIHDCGTMNSYLAGATVEAPTGSRFYLDDALAIDTSLTKTTSGAVLILNATPGVVDYTIHAGPVTFVSWPIVVRAGAFTNSDRFP